LQILLSRRSGKSLQAQGGRGALLGPVKRQDGFCFGGRKTHRVGKKANDVIQPGNAKTVPSFTGEGSLLKKIRVLMGANVLTKIEGGERLLIFEGREKSKGLWNVSAHGDIKRIGRGDRVDRSIKRSRRSGERMGGRAVVPIDSLGGGRKGGRERNAAASLACGSPGMRERANGWGEGESEEVHGSESMCGGSRGGPRSRGRELRELPGKTGLLNQIERRLGAQSSCEKMRISRYREERLLGVGFTWGKIRRGTQEARKFFLERRVEGKGELRAGSYRLEAR